MTLERREQLAQQLSDQLRGLEDAAISRVRGIFTAALAQTIGEVGRLLDRFAEQPEYDPEETPGAFLGSTPDGPARITPDEKNLAAFYLQSQLLQDLTATLAQMALSPEQMEQLDAELRQLFDRAQELGEQYALQLVGAEIQPALQVVAQGPRPELDPVLAQFPDREYQEGQRFTRLFDLAGAVAAAERDFTSLAANYWRQRDEATDEHVRAAKAYYGRWWNDWGETVRFTVGREMAAGPDPRRVKRELEKRIPTVNEAFHNRAETIARTETLMASGEAQERTYRQLRVSLVQYVATADDRTCEFCSPRAGCLYWLGTVKTPIHPNCILGDTLITPGATLAAIRGSYSGNIVTIRTRSGNRLACTENHLVATERGWIAAKNLREGEKVIQQFRPDLALSAVPDFDQLPTTIEQAFQALVAASPVAPMRVPVAAMHLHGDGVRCDGEVDVVWTNRELRRCLQACQGEHGGDLLLQVADPVTLLKAGLSPLDSLLLGMHAATSGGMGRSDLALALLRGHLRPLEAFRFALRAWRHPSFAEPLLQGAPADPELLGQAVEAAAGRVCLDEVVHIDVQAVVSHPVYDLTTYSGLYFASGILTHNCRCDLTPVTLESLALQNAFAADPSEHWETEARATAAGIVRHYRRANGDRPMRPVGGQGEVRGEKDWPLMERTGLPALEPRRGLDGSDPMAHGSRQWPKGDPVWCPRRGWLDPNARMAYEEVVREVAGL